jgi:predicted AAA+ superfamily ATPase
VPAIKRRIDQNRKPGQYLITGSQQWEVLKSLAESLAGRAVFLDLHGFALGEITQELPDASPSWLEAWLKHCDSATHAQLKRLTLPHNTAEHIWRGSFPEAQTLASDLLADFFSAYQRTYIERDVRLLMDVSDVQLFGRFVQLASALTGQEINYSGFGRNLGVRPQTARRWLNVLEATFQWFSVPAFSGNLIKRLSQKPKGYMTDTGLAAFLNVIASPKGLAGHPLWGVLFETAVVGEIRKLAALLSPPPRLYHWRLYSGSELDLLLEKDGVYYPIEIKAKSQPSRTDCRGILSFRENYPRLKIAPGLVIAPTQQFLKISETDYAMPWDARLFAL